MATNEKKLKEKAIIFASSVLKPIKSDKIDLDYSFTATGKIVPPLKIKRDNGMDFVINSKIDNFYF